MKLLSSPIKDQNRVSLDYELRPLLLLITLEQCKTSDLGLDPRRRRFSRPAWRSKPLGPRPADLQRSMVPRDQLGRPIGAWRIILVGGWVGVRLSRL